MPRLQQGQGQPDPGELPGWGTPPSKGRVQRNATKTMVPAGETHVVQKAQAERCTEMGLTVETGTGADTAARRQALGLTKTHWVDAACAGSRRQRPCGSRPTHHCGSEASAIGDGPAIPNHGQVRVPERENRPDATDAPKIRMGDVVHVVRASNEQKPNTQTLVGGGRRDPQIRHHGCHRQQDGEEDVHPTCLDTEDSEGEQDWHTPRTTGDCPSVIVLRNKLYATPRGQFTHPWLDWGKTP